MDQKEVKEIVFFRKSIEAKVDFIKENWKKSEENKEGFSTPAGNMIFELLAEKRFWRNWGKSPDFKAAAGELHEKLIINNEVRHLGALRVQIINEAIKDLEESSIL